MATAGREGLAYHGRRPAYHGQAPTYHFPDPECHGHRSLQWTMPSAWFEDDDFWRELYPYMFPPERASLFQRPRTRCWPLPSLWSTSWRLLAASGARQKEDRCATQKLGCRSTQERVWPPTDVLPENSLTDQIKENIDAHYNPPLCRVIF